MLLLVATLAAGCGGGSAPDSSRLERRARAFELIRGGKTVEAEAILRPLLVEDPRPDPEVDRALTTIYLESYHFNAALAVIDRWLKDDPADPTPPLLRADVHARAGEPPDVLIADFETALKRDPEQMKARLGLADALRLANRHEDALKSYEQVIARRPKDGAARVGAARSNLALGHDDEASRLLDEALAIDPADALALVEQGNLLNRRGRFDEALKWLDRAVAADPFDPESRYKRGLLLSKLGRGPEAKAEQDLAAKLRVENAKIAEIRDALLKTPDDPNLQCEAARRLIDQGHIDEGVAWAERAFKIAPGHPQACRILAEHHEKAGRSGLANYYRTQAKAR